MHHQGFASSSYAAALIFSGAALFCTQSAYAGARPEPRTEMREARPESLRAQEAARAELRRTRVGLAIKATHAQLEDLYKTVAFPQGSATEIMALNEVLSVIDAGVDSESSDLVRTNFDFASALVQLRASNPGASFLAVDFASAAREMMLDDALPVEARKALTQELLETDAYLKLLRAKNETVTLDIAFAQISKRQEREDRAHYEQLRRDVEARLAQR